MTDAVLFGVFPYLAVLFAFGGGLTRYFSNRFSWSSLSSEILEKRWLFWGSVPWHYGIIPLLLAHLFAGLFPRQAAASHASGAATFALETGGLALGLLSFFGLLVLLGRRIFHPSARAVTSAMDWIVLAALAFQVGAGISVAVLYRWGSLWYLNTASPWFWSLARLQPDWSAISPLPWLIKLHMFNGFVLFALFPVSRLVHLVSAPVSYLWRPFLVYVRNKRRGEPGLRA